MPTLTASTPSAISASVPFGGRDVAGDEIDVREAPAQRAHHVEHVLRVAVRGVDDEHVDVGGDQRVGALDGVARGADRGAAAQPAERVLRRVRVLDRLLDVLDGDQPLQPEVAVDDEQLLDLVPVQDLARRVERRADRHGEQRLARHHVGDRAVDVGFEAQIAVGQDADEPPFLAAVLGDRHAGDAVLLHQIERFEDPMGGGERDRIDDHAALRPLDPIDLRRLLLDRQVLVDDAEAALLRHRDRQPRLGDGVHRRADAAARSAGCCASAASRRPPAVGTTSGVARHEQDVVEGQGGGEAGFDGEERRRFGGFHAAVPWHFLYFFPLPQGQGSLRPTFGSSRRTVFTAASSPPTRGGCLSCAGPNGLAGSAACARGALFSDRLRLRRRVVEDQRRAARRRTPRHRHRAPRRSSTGRSHQR